jgi:mannose-1-phosphate guanylyltransferase/phosphomannomutase
MLKRAMMAGLNATGIDVVDLEIASLPVTRFLVRSSNAVGGVSVRLHNDDPQSVVIRFFDDAGATISAEAQRKIERLFQREDHRRAIPEEIGEITFPPRAVQDYAVALESTVELGSIAAHHFKLVVDYSYGATSLVMPNLLAKLGADVLAVNPYASTGSRIAFDRVAGADRVGALVKASGAHLGAVIDPDGERITFIDNEGIVLDDGTALLVFVDLVCDHLLGDRIALPVNTTDVATALAAGRGIDVRPTKINAAALMDASAEPGVGFVADGMGGFILPGFLASFDAAAALVKVLDLLARSDRSLSDVRASLPPAHVVHETVVTPWEQKGLVMRTLLEQASGPLVLVDGVKVRHEGGWALALPDPEEAVTHVWAEGATDVEARRLAHDYVLRIRHLI